VEKEAGVECTSGVGKGLCSWAGEVRAEECGEKRGFGGTAGICGERANVEGVGEKDGAAGLNCRRGEGRLRCYLVFSFKGRIKRDLLLYSINDLRIQPLNQCCSRISQPRTFAHGISG